MLVMHATKENNAFKASDSQYSKIQLFNPDVVQSSEQFDLLKGVIEDLFDGILILTEQKDLIYVNESARKILCQLNQGRAHPSLVPQEIWQVCQFLIQSRSLFPNQHWMIESRIFTEESMALDIRVRWLNIESLQLSCLLITVEDRDKAMKNIAVEEAQSYRLTRREKEVWLLHRDRYTYKQIASELCITPNTVKKHMKSIHAKQKKNCSRHA